jgi:Uma2 family endonuclease
MSAATIAPSTVLRRYITAAEFERMVEAGIFKPDERIELLDGELYEMAAIGAHHASAVRRLINLLARRLGDRAIIDVQHPILLGEKALPQPDILVLHDRDYAPDTFPTPADVFIIIEVADTSLDYDRGVKFPRYAAAGIPEAWLVDLNANIIERHSDPRCDRYHQIFFAGIGDTLSSMILPDLKIPVASVVGPTE